MKIDLRELKYTPNLISLFRLLLSIPLLILFSSYSFNESRFYILALILIAFFSDIADGYVARKTNSISELGKIIDPLADKLLVAIIIINLYLLAKIPAYYFWIVISRDILILVGSIVFSSKVNIVLPSDYLGKITVFLIGVVIIVSIFITYSFLWLFQFLLIVSAIFCFASFFNYIYKIFRYM